MSEVNNAPCMQALNLPKEKFPANTWEKMGMKFGPLAKTPEELAEARCDGSLANSNESPFQVMQGQCDDPSKLPEHIREELEKIVNGPVYSICNLCAKTVSDLVANGPSE